MYNLLRLKTTKYSKEQVEVLIQDSTKLIQKLVSPQHIILIGSSLTEQFDQWSDLDFVLIFDSKIIAKKSEKILYSHSIDFPCPIDFICVDLETYQKKSKIGGIFFMAENSGRKLNVSTI